jgi:hypothetical protein
MLKRFMRRMDYIGYSRAAQWMLTHGHIDQARALIAKRDSL